MDLVSSVMVGGFGFEIGLCHTEGVLNMLQLVITAQVRTSLEWWLPPCFRGPPEGGLGPFMCVESAGPQVSSQQGSQYESGVVRGRGQVCWVDDTRVG